MTKVKKIKVYTYHASHSFIGSNNTKVEILTQLYKIGLYVIINADPAMQIGFDPDCMVKLEKDLKRQEKEGRITNLVFGRAISAYKDEEGFWTEKKD